MELRQRPERQFEKGNEPNNDKKNDPDTKHKELVVKKKRGRKSISITSSDAPGSKKPKKGTESPKLPISCNEAKTDNQVKIVHSKGDGLGNSNFNDAERLKNFEDLLSDKPYWGLNREITLDDKDDNLKFRFKDEKQMKSVEISNNMHVFFCAFGRNFKCPLKRVLTTTQFQYLLENVRLWTPEDVLRLASLYKSRMEEKPNSNKESQITTPRARCVGGRRSSGTQYAKHLEERDSHQVKEKAGDFRRITYNTQDRPDGFPLLGPEKLQQIRQWLVRKDRETAFIERFGIAIYQEDIESLKWEPKLVWLISGVIDFYMKLLEERSELNKKLPKVHGMNTFFFKRLLENGYSGVRRWTRKVDIFRQDVILIPININNVHWCMAIIHIKNKTIKYYDSMGSPNDPALTALAEYLKAESLDKKKVEFDMSGWTTENVRNIPRQENGSDCGVFSCMYAEFVSRNQPFDFSQLHMQYFRMKMVYEICTGKMLN